MIVIVSFSAVSLMLTAAAPADVHLICPLTYCIPILLVAIWFPRQGFRVTALLVAGFLLILTYVSTLGFAVDPVMTGLHATLFLWVFGATVLFTPGTRGLVDSRCREILAETHDAKFLCDPQTLRLLCASPRCAEILGYAPQNLVGVPAERLWADEGGRTRFVESMKRESYIGSMEATLRAQNGDLRAVLLSGRALVPENLYECTIVDAGNLRDGNTDLVRSNERLLQLIQQSNDIFFVQDAEGRILHFSWLRAPDYGISPDDLIGRGAEALLPGDLAARHAAWVRKVVDEQKTVRYDLDLEIGGALHIFSVMIAPYHGADGSFIGVAGSARDTTEIRRQRLACRQMAWEIDQWKGLVATLSHELRTPLQPLIGYLQMIVEDPAYSGINGETEKLLSTCLACARQERAVVERMVELSLLAKDDADLTVQDISVRQLVDSVISSGEYGLETEISNEIPENACIWGDGGRLRLAVECLVSNAVKYNDPPRKVWIRYAESNQNHYIMVCDNGIGIPADRIASIFGSFSIGGAGQPNRNGWRIGLGLSIANKYARLHGGEITVTSVVGEGSTFTIRIPREV
ncbi:PAS domain-containing sensor histidine kinase [Methanoculleus caldifontis]|nr:PAS domain-containing sensor histidine kinase [Methanoculleus sp. Wushi-C6]